jgi:hypothetical protein
VVSRTVSEFHAGDRCWQPRQADRRLAGVAAATGAAIKAAMGQRRESNGAKDLCVNNLCDNNLCANDFLEPPSPRR